jgi:hypothetical protein
LCACTCLPCLSQSSRCPALPTRPNFCSHPPKKEMGVDSALYIPHGIGSSPPPVPKYQPVTAHLPFLVFGQSPWRLLPDSIWPELSITPLVLLLTWGPPLSLGPAFLRKSLGSGLSVGFLHPSYLTPGFFLSLFLFVFSMCVFPNLFTSVLPFSFFFLN